MTKENTKLQYASVEFRAIAPAINPNLDVDIYTENNKIILVIEFDTAAENSMTFQSLKSNIMFCDHCSRYIKYKDIVYTTKDNKTICEKCDENFYTNCYKCDGLLEADEQLIWPYAYPDIFARINKIEHIPEGCEERPICNDCLMDILGPDSLDEFDLINGVHNN